MDTLADKVAVITGGASGLGLALARRFASEGARIVIADVSEQALREAAAGLAATGAEVLAVPTDVSRQDAVDELARRTLETFGAVHVVCNNAGIVVSGPAWEIPLADWQALIGVNLWGVIHGVRTFVPIMLRQGVPGHVVNMASMAGVTSLPTLAAYGASKHAVVALSEVLYHDLAAAGASVGVSVVCPGFVPTHLGQTDKLAPLPPANPDSVTADTVADTIRRAIVDGRFYVFTHPGSTDEVQRRLTGIIDGRAPALRPLPTTAARPADSG
jgi:NAD(P)-dependent dehydrogenase (short-subunit alcohol dehydrogenase family)